MVKLSEHLYRNESACVEELLKSLNWQDDMAARVQAGASSLVEKLRASKRKPGELESFLRQYSLDTEEGLALMCLAEALLRIPDKKTANDLIADKMAAANWLDSQGSSGDWMVRAAGVGLMMTSRSLDGAFSRMSKPLIREAMIKAMQMMGGQFVLGETMEGAIKRAGPWQKKGYRMSYDMLGEGARTAEDAEFYFEKYRRAIGDIAASFLTENPERKPGISVKLSALHPRYESAKSESCIPEISEKLKTLAEHAANHNIPLTVDAEESERLEISLAIIENVLGYKMFEGWNGLGLAVQAYQKRCLPLMDHILDLAKNHNRRIPVRLVKGAYWDREIKFAQMNGLPGFPVFTRKANTDLSYLACAKKMLQHCDALYPMFATHNAHTLCAVLELAQAHKRNPDKEFEFQRLHGMGEGLYDLMMQQKNISATIYAPVGEHRDLLPYLVRRLLENGANSSFVHKILDDNIAPADIVNDPVANARNHPGKIHPKILRPENLYHPERKNSKGIDLNDRDTVDNLLQQINKESGEYAAAPLINGEMQKYGNTETIQNPATGDNVGTVWNTGPRRIDTAFTRAQEGFETWQKTPAKTRAEALYKLADLYEEHHAELMGLCIREAGKTIPDALAEIREAVDFCRYYAERGRFCFEDSGTLLPGPTGEENRIRLEGRGVFVCISPWNFPLAIFTGQIAAALMAGNAVIAKPAEQTPLIATRAAELMHQAGIPKNIIQILPGDRNIGAQIVQHKNVAGVAFTGSTEAARDINRSLAAKDGPIVPLIAETGGQNAMIVDSSALAEQVIDDAIRSAFGSTGQRCSALRVLFLQNDIAEKMLHMLKGAMQQLKVGNPADLSTDIGPVIDEQALETLIRHRQNLEGFGRLIAEAPMDRALKEHGHFFAPCAWEIDNIRGLTREVFGPVLHVIRFDADKIDDVIADINSTGYGLTFGLHSRIENLHTHIEKNISAGNIYINKSTIGAVVGTQPFGGHGLSGTGPKAGGPHYLPRFAVEKVISTNTAAAGGNAHLMTLEEE